MSGGGMRMTVPARDGEEARRGLNDVFPGDPYPVHSVLTGIRHRHVQAIGAGISRRDWHATETAYNSLRDALDDLLRRIKAATLSALATDEAVAQRKEHAEPDEGRQDAGSTPAGFASTPDPMREAFVGVTAALEAATSLLERTPRAKKAAPSDRMFEQMLRDYRKALDEARAALTRKDQP